MKTQIIEIDPENIDNQKLASAAQILKNGGTVAFPTETVYGLGANALDEQAVKKIFEAKGRPSDNPLIIHIAKEEELLPLVQEIPFKARLLMEKFWPGPLTMIFKRTALVPDVITGGLNTVAIRMPSHPIAHKLIEMAGVPVAAPSANISGKPSPTKGQHVIKDLSGRVDFIISGGSCEVGLESTVLDMTEEIPVILRPGGVTREQLEEVLGPVEIDKSTEGDLSQAPKAPGMKYTHYAPKAPVIIVQGPLQDMMKTIMKLKAEKEAQGLKVGIMATEETKNTYTGGVVLSMGSRNKVESIASKIFAVLREFDEKNVEIILAEGIEQKSMGHAVMNRMMKAAGYNIIELRE